MSLSASPSRADWQVLSTVDGLASDMVLCITQDRGGALWFGTGYLGTPGYGRGVSRYDGIRIRTFTTQDGLASNEVLCCAADSAGGVWFGTADAGVSCYDGHRWKTHGSEGGLPSNTVQAILADSRKPWIWCGTVGGLARFDGTTWTTFSPPVAPPTPSEWFKDIRALVQDREGRIWCGTHSQGVMVLDGESWQMYGREQGLSLQIYAGCLDNEGGVWFAGLGGAVRFVGSTWTTLSPANSPLSALVPAVAEDARGNLWFSSADLVGGSYRLIRYDGRAFREFPVLDVMGGYLVQSMYGDREGNLWFGALLGLLRFDLVDWRVFTTADGLPSVAGGLAMDSTGTVWTAGGEGLHSFDGSVWRAHGSEEGLRDACVRDLIVDPMNRLWVAHCDSGGVSVRDLGRWTAFDFPPESYERYASALAADSKGTVWAGTDTGVFALDGAGWRRFASGSGLLAADVDAIFVDRGDRVWVAGRSGNDTSAVCRFDGDAWETIRIFNPGEDVRVSRMAEDGLGNLWLATNRAGAYRFDGREWRQFTSGDGLAGDRLSDVELDHEGNLWFSGYSGVTRWDGENWRTLGVGDGLPSNLVGQVLADRAGGLWMATNRGLARHEPDIVPPRTVLATAPSRVSGSRAFDLLAQAAYGETRVEFSHALDHGAWSEWSSEGAIPIRNLFDGPHEIRSRSRDRWGNMDGRGVTARFEVDATAPSPIVTVPVSGSVLQGLTTIRGTAADARFVEYIVDVRPWGTDSWDPPGASLIRRSRNPVVGDSLARINTSEFPDGPYELRLSIVDSLGLSGSAVVLVVVDNEAPWADETSPAVVSTVAGGSVFTTNGDVHLYFPPRAFKSDAEVTIVPLAEGGAPDTLAGGARRVSPVYDVRWEGEDLGKPATMELRVTGAASSWPEGERRAVYWQGPDSAWSRVGGTVSTGGETISTPFSRPGWYAGFAESTGPTGPGALSAISLTPRVFAPEGGFTTSEVAIGFVLGRGGPVSVSVHNRAGRLVREVLSGGFLEAGANLLRWDGKDRHGVTVADGLYLVTVEAGDQKQTATIAVVK